MSALRVDRALVLTAGYGTRLHPLSAQRAKPAVPVGGEPLIQRILRWLASQGVRDLVLNLHHRPDTLTTVVGDGADLDVRVRYSWEPTLLGSAGGPRRALDLLDVDPFWIVNGDTLTDVDLPAMADRHAATGAQVTLALVPNPRPEHYGGVLVDGDRVIGFTAPGDRSPTFHFVGVQLASASLFKPLAPDQPLDSVGGLYRERLARGRRDIGAFVSDAAFHDIGTPADYLATCLALAPRAGLDRMVQTGERARIAPDARLIRSVLWDDVTIEAGVVLTECVVGDRTRVPAGTRLTGKVLVPDGEVTARPGDERAEGLLIAPLGGGGRR